MFKWFKSVSQLKELGGNVKNNIKFNTSREKRMIKINCSKSYY
jgi:hypothetical protein